MWEPKQEHHEQSDAVFKVLLLNLQTDLTFAT